MNLSMLKLGLYMGLAVAFMSLPVESVEAGRRHRCGGQARRCGHARHARMHRGADCYQPVSSGCYGQWNGGCGGVPSHCGVAMEPSCGAAYADCATGPTHYGRAAEPSCGMAVAPSCGAPMYSQQPNQPMSEGQYPPSPTNENNYGNVPSAPNDSGLDSSPSDRTSNTGGTSTETPPPPADGAGGTGGADSGTGT